MCFIDKSWLIQEPPDVKPDWLADTKPLSRKRPNILLHKSLSKILLQIGSKDTEKCFLRFVCHVFCALVQHKLFSTHMDIHHCLCNGWKCASMVCKCKHYVSLSYEYWFYHDHVPYLVGSIFAIILNMTSSVILTEDNLLFLS